MNGAAGIRRPAATLSVAPASAQAVAGQFGSAECHHHDRREQLPTPPPEVRTSDHAKFQRLQALVAAAYRSFQGGAPNGAAICRCGEEVLRWVF
jgi:hypothetical protein